MSTNNANGEVRLFGSVSTLGAPSDFSSRSGKQTAPSAATSTSYNAADLEDIKLSDLQFLSGNLQAARIRTGRSVSSSSSESDSDADGDADGDGEENVLDVVRRREERDRDGRVKNELLEELCMECGVSNSFELAEQLFSAPASGRRRFARPANRNESASTRAEPAQQESATASSTQSSRAGANTNGDTSAHVQPVSVVQTQTQPGTDVQCAGDFDAAALDLDADFEWLRYVDPLLFDTTAAPGDRWSPTPASGSTNASASANANASTVTQLGQPDHKQSVGTSSNMQPNTTAHQFFTPLENSTARLQSDGQLHQPIPIRGNTNGAGMPAQAQAYSYHADYMQGSIHAQALAYGPSSQPQLVSSYSRCNYKRVPDWHSAASPSPLSSPAHTATDTPYANAMALAPTVASYTTKRACVTANSVSDMQFPNGASNGKQGASEQANGNEETEEDETERVSSSASNQLNGYAYGCQTHTHTHTQQLSASEYAGHQTSSQWQPSASSFAMPQSNSSAAYMPPPHQHQQQQSMVQPSVCYPPTSVSNNWYPASSSSTYAANPGQGQGVACGSVCYSDASSQQHHNMNTPLYPGYDQASAAGVASDLQTQGTYPASAFTSYNGLQTPSATSDACCSYASSQSGTAVPWNGQTQTQEQHKAAQLAELRSHPYYALLRDLAETEIKFSTVDSRFNWRVLMLNLPTEVNRLLSNYRLRNPSVDALMMRRRELVAAGRASPHLDTVVLSAIQNAHASLIAKLRSKSLEAAAASGANVNCVPPRNTGDCLAVQSQSLAVGAGSAAMWPPASVAQATNDAQLAVSTAQRPQNFGWNGELPPNAVPIRSVLSGRPQAPQAQAQSQQVQSQPHVHSPAAQTASTSGSGSGSGSASGPAQSQPQSQAPASNTSARKKSWLPDSSKAVLLNWLGRHLTNPYPSDDEKEQLAQLTGLQLSQVNYWFTNARRRILPKMLAVVHAHALQPGGLAPAPTTHPHPHQATAAAASAVP